jgi:hypothetical protein
MSDDLPSTPEGRLIRRTRETAIPKLTIRSAAARIGMSPEQWGYAERGHTPGRGGNPAREFHPPAPTLARMAQSLTIPPKRLESEGERPDAAEILREILRSDGPRVAAVPVPPARLPEDEDETLITALIASSPDDREVLESIMRLADGEGRLLPWPKRRALMESWLRGGVPAGRRESGTALRDSLPLRDQ